MFESGRRRETRGYIQKPVGGNLGSGLGVSGTGAPPAVAEPRSAPMAPCVTVVISLHSKMRSVPHLKRPQTSAEPSAPLARSLYETTWCSFRLRLRPEPEPDVSEEEKAISSVL